jgi:DNA-binding NtrC family response regulator
MTQDSHIQDSTAGVTEMVPELFAANALADPGSDPCQVVPMLIGSTMAAVERELLLQTLAHCDGNRTHAARVLGVSVRTMRNKLRQYSSDGADVPAAGGQSGAALDDASAPAL